MKLLIASLLLVALITPLQADQAVAHAQQVLKDQGFYYGQITGEKNADTGASIRRYQIRNGLEVTGELNDETLQALRKAPAIAATPATTPPPARAEPEPSRAAPDMARRRDENGGERDTANSPAIRPVGPPPSNGAPSSVYAERTGPAGDGSFRGTPYEAASPEAQHKVMMDAQRVLARKGLFNYPINGVFGPDMEFSLRAYQSRVGLRPSGRLDLETLAALELLPGAHERVYTPRRSYPPGMEPPVRGEWIRP